LPQERLGLREPGGVRVLESEPPFEPTERLHLECTGKALTVSLWFPTVPTTLLDAQSGHPHGAEQEDFHAIAGDYEDAIALDQALHVGTNTAGRSRSERQFRLGSSPKNEKRSGTIHKSPRR
jgi:hypothetical protein